MTLVAAANALDAAPSPKLNWQEWTPDIFQQAQSDDRLVILDLKAVWCHWCHVMDDKTYSDTRVRTRLRKHFLTVRVDQDANPDLSNRYGDWGWPATILFSAKGEELAKLQGYIPPERMVAILDAFIADPTPGPSAAKSRAIVPARTHVLKPQIHAKLTTRLKQGFDTENGGWGTIHRFIDDDIMTWALTEARDGNEFAADMARKTLDGARKLLDPEWGGIYQYSDTADWSSPHYEKIISYQAIALRHYANAYALWKNSADLKSARLLFRYLKERLRSPDGAFFTSQDADVDSDFSGKGFYALNAKDRAKLGRQPKIDTSIYARENGWAIRALIAYADATGDSEALQIAESAAQWVIDNRRINGGGFAHGPNDRGGPFLGDTLAMGWAAVDLYAATGERSWLEIARQAAAFIDSNFRQTQGGYATTAQPEAKSGVLAKPAYSIDEQIDLVRFANLLARYTGNDANADQARHALRYLAADAVTQSRRPLAGLLVGAKEVGVAPTHMTVVGHKDDANAMALHRAMRAHPALYKQIDWWDKREGPLPNDKITYPELDRAAGFACTDRICSLPVFDPDRLEPVVEAMMQATRRVR